MKMAELYQDMKDALRYLDLGFHEMDKVEVTLWGDQVRFSYGGRSTSVELPGYKLVCPTCSGQRVVDTPVGLVPCPNCCETE